MSSKNDLVIFGALGDLSNRKLFPALYQLDRAGLLDDSVRIAALARDDVSTPVFIEQLQVVLAQAFGETTFGETTFDKTTWRRFSLRLHYIKIDFSQKKQFLVLKQWLLAGRTAIYYLATPPSLFSPISKHLNAAGCVAADSRIVLEKPIGHDLKKFTRR